MIPAAALLLCAGWFHRALPASPATAPSSPVLRASVNRLLRRSARQPDAGETAERAIRRGVVLDPPIEQGEVADLEQRQDRQFLHHDALRPGVELGAALRPQHAL